MKQTLLLITCAFGLTYSAFGNTCGVDTLADYITNGSCTLGTGFVFSGFSYTASGDVDITPSEITVTPDVVGGEAGFIFSAPWGLTNGENLDSKIVYTASCDGCQIDDWVLSIDGAGSSGNGFVNVAETSPSVTTGLTQSSVNNVITGVGSGTFPPLDSLTVTKDILVNGGTTPNTTTQVSSVTNLFSNTSTVPEPSLFLLCAGVLGLVPIARRKFIG